MKHKRHMDVHPRTGDYYVRIMRKGVSRYFNLGKNERNARRELEKIENDIASGMIRFASQDTSAVITPDGKDIRIEELANLHLLWVKANRSPGTHRNRKDYLRMFLRYIGPCMVSDITRLKLEEYYSWAKENHGRSANAGNIPLIHVKVMLKWAEDMDVCSLNFKKFPIMRHTNPETPRLTDEEVGKLLAAAPGDFRDLLETGLLTGLRPPELRELRKGNIRIESQPAYVIIERHKTSRSAEEPKPRTVPLCHRALEIITGQIRKHPKSEFIFLNDQGTPWKRYTLRNRFRRLCRKAGVPYVPPLRPASHLCEHVFRGAHRDDGACQVDGALHDQNPHAVCEKHT